MGSRLGQRASKSACFVVPPLFRADSGTNLIKQEGMSKDDQVAWLAGCSRDGRVGVAGFGSRSGHDFFLPCDTNTM